MRTSTLCRLANGAESVMSLLKVEQEAREEIVQDQDEDDRVDHRLGDGAADAAGAADGDEALVAADHPDDHGEHGAFEEPVQDIADLNHEAEVDEERLEADGDLFVEHGDQAAAEPADQDGEEDEDGEGDGDGDEPGHDQVMDRVDVHRAERVDLLVDAHRPNLGGHGRADAAGDENGHHDGGELLADGEADQPADGAGQAALGQDGPGLEGDDAADEEGEDAGHEQAGVADLEQLIGDLLAMPKRQGHRPDRLPEQDQQFANVLKHDRGYFGAFGAFGAFDAFGAFGAAAGAVFF